ncbi:MAG: diguanylate cyclase, partial [Cyanobacteria bacterium P01_F01_bin.3]
ALLVTSLTAVTMVSAISRWFVFQNLNQAVLDISFGVFQEDVKAYFETYGSWDEGQDVEPFDEFIQRRRPVGRALHPPPQLHRLPRLSEHVLPGPGHPPGLPPLPDPAIAEIEQPPFTFLLLDAATDRILLGPDDFTSDQEIPNRLFEQREPIFIGGQPVAIAVPLGTPNLNQLDKRYLASLNRSLLYGMAVGSISALLLGVTLGGQLGAPLRQLKRAIQAMNKGELHQEVPVRSQDEIGLLTAAFNQMSADLAQAYESLQTSHSTIQLQAAQLKELSIRDELTKLYNRRYFNEQAAQYFELAHRHHQPLSIAIGDIDCFKAINDTFSHGVGDEVLRQVAEILMTSTRKSDIIARYGGEEFIMAFPNTELCGAEAVCEQIRQAIAAYEWEDIHPHLRVTISIGIGFNEHAKDVEVEIAAADRQLYRAKHSGRNQVMWADKRSQSAIASHPTT